MAVQYGMISPNHILVDPNATSDHGSSDAGSIQSAIDTLPGSGGIVELTIGTYNFTSNYLSFVSKDDNVTIRGAGNGTVLYRNQSTYGARLINCNGADNLTFENFKVTGNSAYSTSGYAFYSTGCDSLTMDTILFDDIGMDQAYIGTCTDARVQNCYFDNCRYNGLVLDAATYSNITNNHLYAITSNVAALHSLFYASDADGTKFIGNIMHAADSNYQYGMLKIYSCTHFFIADNVVCRDNSYRSNDGIIVVSSCTGVQVEENNVYENVYAGIYIGSSDNIHIKGNLIREVDDYGIQFVNSTHSIAAQNVCTNCTLGYWNESGCTDVNVDFP